MAAPQAEAGPSMAPRPEADKGSTMLEKHRERLERARREIATRKLHALVPEIGKLARAMALEETNFNADEALELLRKFQARHPDQLAQLLQRRADFLQRREAERGGGAGTSGSDSDDGSRGRRGRGKHGRDGSVSPGRSRKRSKREKREKKDKKEKKDKREKRDRKRSRRSRSRSRSPRAEAGRYGIIYADADYEYKRPEFTLWAREALGKDVDNLTRRDEQALFARFVEAYNTASLPHRKYYDLAEYERRKALKFARLHGIAVVDGRDGGGGSAGEVGGADGAGVSREREVEEERRKEKEEKIRKAYEELRASGKADEMRRQRMMLSEAQLAFKTGDMSKASSVLKKLQPEPERPKKSRGMFG